MSRRTGIIAKGNQQKGFSLVELMVAMVVSMVTMAGVISLFANSVKSNSEALQHTRLNQELRAIMDVMVRDIRRAGYFSAATANGLNPFQPSGRAVQVDATDCITYLYQKDPDDPNPGASANQFGFRLQSDAVKLRDGANSCADTSGWAAISDSNVVTVTKLEFDLYGGDNDNQKTYCTNLTTGSVTSASEWCDGANPGDMISKVYIITIKLEGQLTHDSGVTLSLQEKVVVKNTVTQQVPAV